MMKNLYKTHLRSKWNNRIVWQMATNGSIILDYYEVLGIPREANTEDIKKSFQQLIRKVLGVSRDLS